jgi:hypothetical protein
MRHSRLLLIITLVFLSAACAATPAPAESDYRTTATVKDIMDSMIDPSADVIWDSVATIVDESGTHERFPQNDEEWANVRRHTITLLEATNLLLIPGRHIARPGEKADDPNVELAPEAIESMVNQDRAAWTRLVHGLHDVMSETLKAVDAKDKEAIYNIGERIDQACENCHLKYWYPNDIHRLRRY